MSSMMPSARAGWSIGRYPSIRSSRNTIRDWDRALRVQQTAAQSSHQVRPVQFNRLPDGSWVTTVDVSLDYTDKGTHDQDNFSKGVPLSASHDNHYAMIVAVLEEKCGTNK